MTTDTQEQDWNERLWDDFEAMIKDVHQHVRSTGVPVDNGDDPFKRRIGYEDKLRKIRWSISLTKVRDFLAPPRDDKRQVWGTMLGSPAGRYCIANSVLLSQ